MTMATATIEEAIREALDEHFDAIPYEEVVTFDVAGWEVGVVVTPDDVGPMEHINDYDESIFGRLEWGDRASTREYDRPDEFDGNAERIDRYSPGSSQGDYEGLWWQPPKAGPLRGTPEFDQLRRELCDLLTHGYVGVSVDVSRTTVGVTCPTCHHTATTVESGHDSLWGVEGNNDNYIRSVIAECIENAIAEAS